MFWPSEAVAAARAAMFLPPSQAGGNRVFSAEVKAMNRKTLPAFFVFFLCAFLVTSGMYLLLHALLSGFVFGALFRMFLYHWEHPYQYISLVCLCYAALAAALAPRVARNGRLAILVVLLSPLAASPFGGALWHYHDMLAGFFPPDPWSKLLRGVGEGLSAGWLILLLSFPYNLFCAALGVKGTVWLAKKFYPQASGIGTSSP